jgi:hypothetical protein
VGLPWNLKAGLTMTSRNLSAGLGEPVRLMSHHEDAMSRTSSRRSSRQRSSSHQVPRAVDELLSRVRSMDAEVMKSALRSGASRQSLSRSDRPLVIDDELSIASTACPARKPFAALEVNDEEDGEDEDEGQVESYPVFVEGTSSHIIDPRCTLYLYWIAFLLVVTLMVAFLTPYEIAFLLPSSEIVGFEEAGSVVIGIFNILIFIVFAADMVINVNLAYVSQSGVLVTKRRWIFFEYLRFWFWIDLLSTLPWNAITSSSGSR